VARVARDDSPAEERRAIAYAIAWMERRVAPSVRRPTVRAWTLLVLERYGLIRHHIVERPFAKDSLVHWTHWAALIQEKASRALFSIASPAGANGENPTVQAAASFCVPDTWADNRPPETGLATPPILMARRQRKEPTALLPCSSTWRPWATRTALPHRHVEISAGSLSSWSASSIGLKERR
jgi:hypothetical protein